MVRALAGRPAVRDVALAVALLAGSVVLSDPNTMIRKAVGAYDGPWPAQLWVWWVAAVLATTAVALRRLVPFAMLAMCVLATATHLLVDARLTLVDLAAAVPLYTIASRHRPRVSGWTLAVLVLLAVGWSIPASLATHEGSGLPDAARTVTEVQPDLADGLPPEPPDVVRIERRSEIATGSVLVLGSVMVAAWAVGSNVRTHRGNVEKLRTRTRDLERERDQQAALATAAERARLSRDLHDVVAHGLSVMVVQAQGGLAALENQPTGTRTALEAIITTGRTSLADMRQTLSRIGQLEDSLHPQPGLAEVPRLVERVRGTGTPVRLRVEGSPVPLSSAVDLAAYRIVQEALTNTVKHAGQGATAEVVVSYQPDDLHLDVTDDGRPGAGTARVGRGLRGMRERATLLGGELRAEPGTDGGFVVQARLPYQDGDR